MKKNKKFLIVSIFMFAAALPAVFSQTTVINAGTVVFVPSPEGCRIMLNGEDKGDTPVLLTGLESGENEIFISSGDKYAAVTVLVDNKKKIITTLTPEMHFYSGSLRVDGNPSGAEVIIDGESAGVSPLTVDRLNAGEHMIEVRMADYLVLNETVEISWDRTSELGYELEKGCRLSIEPQLPGDAVVTVKDGAGGIFAEYGPADELLLPKGVWQLEISGNTFRTVSRSIKAEEDEAVAAIDIEKYTGRIVLKDIPPGAVITMDGMPVEIDRSDNSFSVDAGTHSLYIEAVSFVARTMNVAVEADGETVVFAAMQKDAAYEQQMKEGMILPAMLGGAVLAAGGFVLNMDSISMELSDSYGSYSAIKYSSLGVMGAGVILTAIGGFLMADSM